MDKTYYSDVIKGDKGNYNWGVKYDISMGGYLGITQHIEGVNGVSARNGCCCRRTRSNNF